MFGSSPLRKRGRADSPPWVQISNFPLHCTKCKAIILILCKYKIFISIANAYFVGHMAILYSWTGINQSVTWLVIGWDGWGSVCGRSKHFSFCYHAQISFWAHSASYPVGTGKSFPLTTLLSPYFCIHKQIAIVCRRVYVLCCRDATEAV
jgi:hypothetical protein